MIYIVLFLLLLFLVISVICIALVILFLYCYVCRIKHYFGVHQYLVIFKQLFFSMFVIVIFLLSLSLLPLIFILLL